MHQVRLYNYENNYVEHNFGEYLLTETVKNACFKLLNNVSVV